MSEPAKVHTLISGGVATITMADEDNRNALGGEFVNQLFDALEAALADDAVRVIKLTNSGKVFCAGADLKEASAGGRTATTSRGLAELLSTIIDSPKPVIGQIAGHAVGGGVGLAAALDIAIAADDTKFGFSEVRLGVAPAIISVVCLPKMTRGRAMETFLRGNRFDAAEAADLGLIAGAAPRGELETAVDAVISDVLAGGPAALHAAKQLVNQVPGMNRGEAFSWTSKLSSELFNGEEAAAGMSAFLSKTPAPWIPQTTTDD